MTTEKTISYNKGKDKSTVNGYIRKIEQNIFSSNNESFYNNIPTIINYLCISYYHISKDRFDPILHGKHIRVSDNWISWKPYGCLLFRGSSAFLSNIVSNHKHQWRFKIINTKTYAYIGVRANKTDPTDNELNSLHYPLGSQAKNGSFGLQLKFESSLLRGDPQRINEQYCPVCSKDDIIDMYLDLNKFELSFAINNKHYGKAFDVDKTSYRAVCCLILTHKALELLFYKTMD